MLRRLMGMLVGQHGINERLEATIERLDGAIVELHGFTRQQGEINTRLTGAIERLDVTQARMETLLSRLFGPADNGRDA